SLSLRPRRPRARPCSRRARSLRAGGRAGPGGGGGGGHPPGEGIRIIRIDPGDPALASARVAAPSSPLRDAPFRAIDDDFWQDDRGAIRGWIELLEKRTEAARAAPASPEHSPRAQGVSIDDRGKLTFFPLPDGVSAVVRGGRFAI